METLLGYRDNVKSKLAAIEMCFYRFSVREPRREEIKCFDKVTIGSGKERGREQESPYKITSEGGGER